MLTDFDLSKGSQPPGNPCVVKSGSPHVVSFIFIQQVDNTNMLRALNSHLLSILKAVLLTSELTVLLEQKVNWNTKASKVERG